MLLHLFCELAVYDNSMVLPAIKQFNLLHNYLNSITAHCSKFNSIAVHNFCKVSLTLAFSLVPGNNKTS